MPGCGNAGERGLSATAFLAILVGNRSWFLSTTRPLFAVLGFAVFSMILECCCFILLQSPLHAVTHIEWQLWEAGITC